MNIANIKPGDEFKNYKVLCETLGEPIKGGDSKNAQLKEWGKYFSYKKTGRKIRITAIVREKENILNLEEVVMEYGTKDIQEHYKNNGKLNAGLTRKLNNRLTELVSYEENNKKYTIKEVYKTPLPRNISKMKSNLYQYIIPLILQSVLDSNSDVVALTIHKLARNIDMINKNYDIIKYNKDIFIDEYDDKTIVDYFNRMDDDIKYYIKQSIELLANAHILDYSYVNYIQLKSNEIELDKDYSIVNHEEEQVNRRATNAEDMLKFDLEQRAMEIAGIDPLKEGSKACYYGKKSKKYYAAYNFLLNEENEKRENYKIERFYKAYELVAPDKELCKKCLSYFDTDSIVENFNEHFMMNIIRNAKKRQDKDIEHIKYNPRYIDDFSNLVLETIPKSRDSLLKDEQVRGKLYKKNKEFMPILKTRKFSKKENLTDFQN